MDFHLSVWRRERERENYHVGMRNLIFLLSHRKFSSPFVPGKKLNWVQLFSRALTGKSNDSQSNRFSFVNTTFLLFLNCQSNTTLFVLFFSRSCLSRARSHSRRQTDKWKSNFRACYGNNCGGCIIMQSSAIFITFVRVFLYLEMTNMYNDSWW